MIAVDRPDLARPGILDHQVSACFLVLDQPPALVHEAELHAEERPGGRAGLQLGGAGQRGDHDPAGFRLPPGIDDGAALFADHVVIPLPGLRVDGFAHRAEELEGRAGSTGDVLVALTHQLAERRRGGIENVDLVLVHHLPAA